jgi:beta-lactamase superfamily II metal-dependent hydrolase
MSVIKSFAVGAGDTFYIEHNTDNFTIIDCYLSEENKDVIITELKSKSSKKGITRFISTHPDEDHFSGIHWLDDEMPIYNFYVVNNQATKPEETESFSRYCKLRDGDKAFYVTKGCKRKWMNESGDGRDQSGIQILWPDVENKNFKQALNDANEGIAFNDLSLIARYSLENGASVLWLGDLTTDFMEAITDHVPLTKTDIVFAAHHGRTSGKIPNSWLDIIDPEIIVLGEAPSRHLHYYSGYNVITQNSSGDITFDLVTGKVHIYVSKSNYGHRDWLADETKNDYPNYVGTLIL